MVPDAFVTGHSREVISLAARYRLPTVYSNLRLFPEGGGVLSYGSDVLDNFRRAAIYADRILKGAKPGELPVQAPEKFELVINLKDRESPRPQCASSTGCSRRRGDRIADKLCLFRRLLVYTA